MAASVVGSVVQKAIAASKTQVTPSRTTTAGNAVAVAIVTGSGDTITSVTDNKTGNTYTRLADQDWLYTGGGGDDQRLSWFGCDKLVGAGTGHTWTVQFGGTPIDVYCTIIPIEISGQAATSPFDTATIDWTTDASSPFTQTTTARTQADNLILALLGPVASGTSVIAATYDGTAMTTVQSNGDNASWSGAVFSASITSAASKVIAGTATGAVAIAFLTLAVKSAGSAGVTVNLSSTDAADTLAATAAAAISAALSRTDAADTLSATTTEPVTAALAVTDAADVLSAAAAAAVIAQLGSGDAADTLASTAGALVLVNLAATDAADTLASDAVIGAAPVDCTLAVTDAADTLSAAALVAVSAALSTVDAADTLASAVALPVAAALAVGDASDALDSTAAVALVAELAVTDDADTLEAFASTGALGAVTVTLEVTDADDVLTSTLAHDLLSSGARRHRLRDYADFYAPPIEARLAVTDDSDTVASTVRVGWALRVVGARIADDDDSVVAAAVVVPWPALALQRVGLPLVREGAWRPTRRPRSAEGPR